MSIRVRDGLVIGAALLVALVGVNALDGDAAGGQLGYDLGYAVTIAAITALFTALGRASFPSTSTRDIWGSCFVAVQLPLALSTGLLAQGVVWAWAPIALLVVYVGVRFGKARHDEPVTGWATPYAGSCVVVVATLTWFAWDERIELLLIAPVSIIFWVLVVLAVFTCMVGLGFGEVKRRVTFMATTPVRWVMPLAVVVAAAVQSLQSLMWVSVAVAVVGIATELAALGPRYSATPLRVR